MSAVIRTRCLDCQSVFHVTRIRDAVEEPLAFCIFCGANNVKCGEDDKDYWTTLAQDLNITPDKLGASLVENLFEQWSPYEGDAPRFMDFAREMLATVSQPSQG